MGTAENVMIHGTAVVDPRAVLGPGTVVWSHACILAGAVLGARCRVGHGAYIDRGVRIGDNAWVHNHACLYRPVELSDDVFVGPHVVFVNDPDPRADLTRDLSGISWKVGRGATIGANATILSDIDLAEHCFVGAGAVLTQSTRAFGIYAGVPARLVGFRCTCRARYPLDPGLPKECVRCHHRF